MPYRPGDDVLVPASRVGLKDHPSALVRTRVVESQARSVKVALPTGEVWDRIASSKVHDELGVAIITIGDLATENALLNPLSKSILQFFRLLIPSDDEVRRVFVRSRAELRHFWREQHALLSHAVVIAHGRSDAVRFFVDGWQAPDDLDQVFQGSGPKHFTFLACKTGRVSFGKGFSRKPYCRTLIAPYHAAHGAIASMYVQTYFNLHFLGGESEKVAYNNAAQPVKEQAQFRFWKNGEHKK